MSWLGNGASSFNDTFIETYSFHFEKTPQKLKNKQMNLKANHGSVSLRYNEKDHMVNRVKEYKSRKIIVCTDVYRKICH